MSDNSDRPKMAATNEPEINQNDNVDNVDILNDITNSNLASNIDNEPNDDILNSSTETELLAKSLEILSTTEKATDEPMEHQVSISSTISFPNSQLNEQNNQDRLNSITEDCIDLTNPSYNNMNKNKLTNSMDKETKKTNPEITNTDIATNKQLPTPSKYDETPIINTSESHKPRKNLNRSAKLNVCYLQLSGKENKQKKENNEKETNKKGKKTPSATSSPKRPETGKDRQQILQPFVPNPEERIIELRKTNQLKQVQIDEMKQEVRHLKRTIEELLAELDITTTKEEQFKEREAQYRENEQKLREENERLRHEYSRLKDSQQDTTELEKMRKRMQKEIEKLTAINNQQQEAIDELQQQKAILIRANQECQEFEKDLKERNKIQEDRLEVLNTRINATKRQNERDTDETPSAKRYRPSTSTYQQESDAPINPHNEIDNKSSNKKYKTKPETETRKNHSNQTESSEDEDVTVNIIRKEQEVRRPAKIVLITEKIYDATIYHLKRTSRDKEIFFLQNCTSIADLENKLESEQLVRELIAADQIVILFGGTEIKRGTPARELASRIQEIVRKITRETITQVKVCELPPLEGDDKTRREREKFNEKIRELGQRCFKLNRVSTLKLVETVEEDGRTLTDLAADRIARDIDVQAMPGTVASQTRKITINYDHSSIGRIIGKNGKNRQHIEDSCQVHLVAYKNTIIIKGHPSSVIKAQQEIEYQAQQYERDRARYEKYYQSTASRENSPV